MLTSLAYGSGRLLVEVPDDAVVIEPRSAAGTGERGRRPPVGVAVAGRRPTAAAAGEAPSDGRHLGVRHHPAAAAAADDPGDPRGARRRGRHRRRRDPRRHRHPSGEHRRPSCARCSATPSSTRCDREPRCSRRRRMAWVGRLGRDVPVWLNRRWMRCRRAHHDRVRRAALLRRVLRWTEDGRAGARRLWTPSSCSTTRRASATAGDVGHHQRQPGARRHPRDRDGTGVTFSLDVVLNREQRIVQAFAGDLLRCTRRRRRRRGRSPCGRSPSASTSCSRPGPAIRSTRTCTRR